MSDVMHNSWVERDALGRRPSQGPGQGGGSIWESNPDVKAAAARVCEAYARDADELAEFLDALGIEAR